MRINGKILVTIGIILICSSWILILYNNYVNNIAGIKTKEAYDKIQELLEDVEVNEDIRKMEIVSVGGNDYIGTINIPSLNLELPIIADWDNDKMKVSPCRYYGSIYTNDLVLCSHSYDNLFGNIHKLKQGDKLILTDMNHQEFIYEVMVVEVLEPNDVVEMIESEFDLTLYTCTKDNLNRITVRLNKISD